MKKERLKNLSLVFLLGLTVFSVFKYIYSLREKYDLVNALGQIMEEAAILASEKQALVIEVEREKELQQQLTQENSVLNENLRISEQRLAQLDSDFAKAQESIEELNSKFALLKAENSALIERKDQLNTQLSEVSQENVNLKAKMSSITELKKAIRELKKQVRKVGVTIREKMKPAPKAVEGNRGYLIKDGKFTYPSRVKIEVIPAPVSVEE
jgi:chromosome segregation ATPase